LIARRLREIGREIPIQTNTEECDFMKFLLTMKNDFVFKKLLCESTEILIDLLNSVLELSEKRRIRSVQIKNPIILPEEITQKYIVLDILATDEAGYVYNIEMQVRQYADYSKRALFYASRLYAGQLESGEDYGELKPVIGIHFLNYEEYSDYDDFHFRFEMRDVRNHGLRLTEDMTIHIFELPKFERSMKKSHIKDAMTEWLRFFNHAHEEDETMRASYENPVIHKAFGLLEDLSADEKNRYLAEVREKAMRNERSELAAARREGRKEGFEEGRKEGAEEVIRQGICEAIELGLSLRFGDEGLEMMPAILHIKDCDRLRAIKNAIRTAKDISEFKAIAGN
jgi:predicted transposase/invertase (TIGR01784 family)